MNNPRSFYIKRRGITLLLLIYFIWYVTVPRVVIYFSEDGTGELKFVLNTKHEIFRGRIHPGESTGGPGHLFPDENFFMQLDWNNLDKRHCIRINPEWPTTNIVIAADGTIDRGQGSGTDTDRLTPCPRG